MLKKFKKFTLQMIGGANVASIVIMLLIGYSGFINPERFPKLSNIGLIFPLFLVINLAFLIFWLIVKPKFSLIPLLGFIICYGPVRTHCPFNISSDPPKGAFKVLSYNVWLFAGWEDHGQPNPILRYIRLQNADIVCLQESAPFELRQEKIDSVLNPIYPYHDIVSHHGNYMSIYSKYPILSRERIDIKSKGNLSTAYKLYIEGKEVIVINNHLETTDLSVEDKQRFKLLMKGDMKTDTAEHTSKMLIRKLGEQTAKRAPQADAVARYISYNQGTPIIVCGDFNDNPLSYVRRTIADGLTDCYVSTANGPGISYHKAGFYVRIDNMMCSSDFKPYRCKVDNSIKTSDHYPISCYFKLRDDR